MAHSFEEQLKGLETIVKALEEGDLPLDKAMDQYQEGMKIAQAASKKLDEAKAVLKEMLETDETVPFDDSDLE
jgi:exodeoxyribonuclease VII, small subunit